MHIPMMSMTNAVSIADSIGDTDSVATSSWGAAQIPANLLVDPTGLMDTLGGVELPPRQGGPMSFRRGQAHGTNHQNHYGPAAAVAPACASGAGGSTLRSTSSPALSRSASFQQNRGRGVGPSGSIPATTLEANSSEEGGGESGSGSGSSSSSSRSRATSRATSTNSNSPGSQADLLDAEIMQLATCDNESGDVMDLWGSLLPLASQGMNLAEAEEKRKAGSSDGLDVYAF